MKNERLLYSIGGITDRYISEAGEEEARRGRRAALLRKTALLVAVVAAALLLCAAGIYVVTGGDLWIHTPSNDPEEVVREALENQAGKDYTVSIKVESVAIDREETRRVTERVISGVIAQWRGWSDEYLAEHFVVVKAAYCAEYDHAKTTRSDGDVVMYFYVVQDVDSGRWRIVDNSGNVNLADGSAEPEESASVPPAPPSIQGQIEKYLSEMFTRAYSPYYDGLHYKMSGYEETVSDGVCTATFLWTMYHLGKGWDVGSDEGVELTMNVDLQVTAVVNDGGELDLSTILILADISGSGPRDYSFPIEESFPTQLAD